MTTAAQTSQSSCCVLLWIKRSTRQSSPVHSAVVAMPLTELARNCTSHEALSSPSALRPVSAAHPSGTHPKAHLPSRPTVNHFSKQHTATLLSAATNMVGENPRTDATTGLWRFWCKIQLYTTMTANKYYAYNVGNHIKREKL